MGKDSRDERKKKDKVSKSDKKEKKHRKEKHKKDSKDKDKDKHRHRKERVVDSSSAGNSSAVSELTADDFYLRHEEFRVWLHLKERSFEDLSSEQAHTVFEEEFIKQFNKGKLPAMFYPQNQVPGDNANGIPSELREAAMKTKHKWNLKVTDRDRQQQEQIQQEVSRKTHVNTDNAWVHMAPVSATGKGKTMMSNEPSRCTTSAAVAAVSFSGSSLSSSSSQSFARQKAAAVDYLDNHSAGSSDRREAAMQMRDTVAQKIHAASR